jgi:hypothetical protein
MDHKQHDLRDLMILRRRLENSNWDGFINTHPPHYVRCSSLKMKPIEIEVDIWNGTSPFHLSDKESFGVYSDTHNKTILD